MYRQAAKTNDTHHPANARMARPLAPCLAAALLAPALTLGPLGQTAHAGEFDVAEIYFERNDTDGDTGIQLNLDGDAWRTVEVVDPSGNKIFEVSGKGSLEDHGLVELFFESNEPPDDEVPLEQLVARFPAGDYQVRGQTVDGEELTGTATLTHVVPAGAEIVSPAEGATLDPSGPIVITWRPVTASLLGQGDVDIVRYQVIVETGEPPRAFTADLAPAKTSVTVPVEFLEPATEYDFEVLAEEKSGNLTVIESNFETGE
jgi:hypothetical protein